MIIQLINTGDCFPRDEYQRHWLEPGEPMYIGDGSYMQLLLNVSDGRTDPVLRIETFRRQATEFELSSSHFDLRPWSKLYCIPRAAELDALGKPCRVLLEFISLVKDRPMEIIPCAF